ncbi:MAG: hypothetical protein RIS70_1368 [Planctomycetota bacterium]
MDRTSIITTIFCTLVALAAPTAAQQLGEAKHGFVTPAPDKNGAVKLHYVTLGKGPLLVMLHGFPDFWYTWRKQMPALAEHFQVVAYDQRGYNESDQPEGVENYTVDKLVADLDAVIDHFPQKKAIVAGHDWGGMVAWSYAMAHPEKTERLMILNLPHPQGILRELANNPLQRAASQYAREFQKPDAASKMTPEMLTFWIRDAAAKEQYVQAFKKSSIEGMLNYYKANYPREPYEKRELPKVQCPVLMFHGLKDPALLPGALNDTWNWVAKDLTLITIPEAGHWVHDDAAEHVTRNMLRWLRD